MSTGHVLAQYGLTMEQNYYYKTENARETGENDHNSLRLLRIRPQREISIVAHLKTTETRRGHDAIVCYKQTRKEKKSSILNYLF